MAFSQKLIQECWICGYEVSLEECKIDEHGQAVHEECYVVALALSGTPQPEGKRPVQIQSDLMPTHEPTIRCAYCRLGNEFRPMIILAEGWLQCESCGHNAMPLDPEFKCTCASCESHALVPPTDE
jgi:hypothetical protein